MRLATPRCPNEPYSFTTFLTVSESAKLLVAIGGFHADAHDDRALAVVLGQVLLEVVRLDGAALRHVLGVEVQDHPAVSPRPVVAY